MDLIRAQQFNLTNLSKINILLGKNGSGKSSLLKKIDTRLRTENIGEVVYVTPERGGFLQYDSSVEQNSTNVPDFVMNNKRRNQWGQFKNHSIIQYRQLELLSLRELEKNMALRTDPVYSFNAVVEKINRLLDNIKIVRTAGDFEIRKKENEAPISAAEISSGESELISLSIECLRFEKKCIAGRTNLLLIDEPDVHLHPDLQSKLVYFLTDLLASNTFTILIATHSTAILGALLNYQDSRFGILEKGSGSVAFREIDEVHKNILPIFGAHPLSNLFNESPVFLVEGEDDVRIFQQAIRSSNGILKLYPCSVDGKGNFPTYEPIVREMISGVYDEGKAYSFRDKDDDVGEIQNNPPLIRFRLACRTAENLVLTDEVLTTLETNWGQLQLAIEKWIQDNGLPHVKFADMVSFRDSGYDRKNHDIKNIRNVLIGLTPSTKPWEVAVGKTIADVVTAVIAKDMTANKLCHFLGQKFSDYLRP